MIAIMQAGALALVLLVPAFATAAQPTGEKLARSIDGRARATQGSRIAILELHATDDNMRVRRMHNFWMARASHRIGSPIPFDRML